ncbi:hypothetical protein F2Q70_00001586 [Brassica cretica]|uniref:Uncharacterized protein n=1 Tax=Brassica cretica TaxID=69181 RepID=A0A8S9ITN0_BRACR|nr:hypothetical protein F2Q70_00001586 [Brassica cretica]
MADYGTPEQMASSMQQMQQQMQQMQQMQELQQTIAAQQLFRNHASLFLCYV